MAANRMLHLIPGIVLIQEKLFQDGFKPESIGMPSKRASHKVMLAWWGRANMLLQRFCYLYLDGLRPSHFDCLRREGTKLTRMNVTTASALAF